MQFLPPPTPLVQEALENSVEFDVEGERVRVFTAEHLAAIALEVGRGKDKARLLQFIEQDAIDRERFLSVLSRHHLVDRWHIFGKQFLSEKK